MRKILHFILTFILLISVSGCSSYIIAIDSDPTEADVNLVNDEGKRIYAGKTPVKITSKHIPEGDYTLILSKPGYEDNSTFRGNLKRDKKKKLDLGTRTLKKAE